jgi:multidrug efflux pump subunit AcrA (membrane-fusion protein)
MKKPVKHQETLEFSFRHPYSAVQLGRFSSLYSIKIPGVLNVVGCLLVGAFLVIGIALTWVPWVQTTTGTGVVTTLDPRDRVQNISALVSGRIAEWYVRDAQFVRAGDPLVRIQDVDDELLSRLEAQLAAARRRYQAAREAVATSEIDLERRKSLFENGLTSRLELEQASIRVQQLRISEEQVLAEVNAAEVNLSRQGSQMVHAPRDGTIVHVEAGDIATLVNAGQTLATFMPADTQRVVEMYIEGRDIGLVQAGRKVRLEFDGWPAFQFSGMPQFAVGTFAGEVSFVEPGARADGRFRVVVTELNLDEGCLEQATRPGLNVAGNCGWPPETYIRLGALARGWILLETVPLGYELWRVLNNFPPVNSSAGQKVPSFVGGN